MTESKLQTDTPSMKNKSLETQSGQPKAKTVSQTEHIITHAVSEYFFDCRQRIPVFIQNHFTYPGTWHTNKRALGWDLVKAPINLFWAPIYLALQLIAFLMVKAHLDTPAKLLRTVPSGLTTKVQRHLGQQTFSELLGRSNNNDKDALYQTLNTALQDMVDTDSPLYADHIHSIEIIVNDALEQYRITRTASADIGNSLFSTIVGAFAFQKFTPGGFAVGLVIASWLANYLAVDNFFLGNWAGSIYYSVFPATPSLNLMILSVAAVLALLAVIASFSGLITDPVQTWTGIHRRRLEKMLDRLEKDFLEKKVGGFRPKDQFLARVLEVVDAAKAHLF